MFKYVVTGLMAVALVAAVPAPEQPNVDCFNKDSETLSCLAVKAISTINRVARSPKLEIIEGVSFVRDSPGEENCKKVFFSILCLKFKLKFRFTVERSSRALETESAMIADLPKDPIEKTMSLVGKFVESGVNFLKSHSLNVNPEGVARAGLDGIFFFFKFRFNICIVGILFLFWWSFLCYGLKIFNIRNITVICFRPVTSNYATLFA